MAIGGASGYLTVNPTQDYVGQALQGATESFARVRAEKIAQERDRMINEQNIQEQRRQDIKDAEEFSAKYPFVAIGNKSIDSKKRQDLETGKKSYNDALDRYKATGDKKELAMANSILESIKEIPEMGKALSLTAEGWIKNEANLNPSSLAKAKKILEVIQTDMTLDYDENGRSVYSIPKRDDAGNITGYLHKNISGEQLKELLNVEPKFDVTGDKGFVSQYIKSLNKPDVTTKTVGNKDITTTKYQGSEAMAKKMALDATNNHSAVYAALEDLGLDPNDKSNYSNQEVLGKVAGYYENLLNETTKESVSEKLNLDQAKFDHTKSQDAISNANEKTRISIAKEVAAKDKKGIRFTIKNGMYGKETSATMNMTDQEYADYLMNNGVKDVKTMEEVWNNPINAGYVKAVENSKAKKEIKGF